MKYLCTNCDLELLFFCVAPTAPKQTQNHDDPAYADPGDGGSIDGPDWCPHCNESVDKDRVMTQFLEERQDAKEDYREREQDL